MLRFYIEMLEKKSERKIGQQKRFGRNSFSPMVRINESSKSYVKGICSVIQTKTFFKST
jgi:hypothetical protein